jgi:hypothetical protein
MWNAKRNVMPVIIRATGTISKSFRKYLNNILESETSRDYRQQPYLAIRTYFNKAGNP